MSGDLSRIFWNVFVIDKRCKGPNLVNILEVSEMIQKVLEYVRGTTLAIFGLIKTRKKRNAFLKTKKTTTPPKMFAEFWALLDPRFGPQRSDGPTT